MLAKNCMHLQHLQGGQRLETGIYFSQIVKKGIMYGIFTFEIMKLVSASSVTDCLFCVLKLTVIMRYQL